VRNYASIGSHLRRRPGSFGEIAKPLHAIALALTGIACTSAAANAGVAADGQRFQLSGSGTLTVEQPAQTSADMRLKAYLLPKDAAIAALPPLQEGGGFALIASVKAQSLVCYADTIFRDDFDGDGG